MYRFARVCGCQVDWRLQRNCSVTPAQLAWLYASLCVVSVGIGTWFALHGAWLVLGFAWIELLAVGLAFSVYARHATDGERISLCGERLEVELEQGGRLTRAAFDVRWLRVEPKAGQRSLIELSGQGRSVEIGRFVRPELRPLLAREIRMALRGA